jgi:predicted phage terminase large subunit-like protein
MDFAKFEQALAKEDLLRFGLRMEPRFTAARHIRFLCDLLCRMEKGEVKRVCVSIGPRFGKSTLCSKLFPAWCLGRDSTRQIIIASHSADLAMEFSRDCKAYTEKAEWPFAEVKLSEDSKAGHRWHVTPGNGGLHSFGVGSNITGIGADLIVVDDPLNDGLNELEQERAWSWYQAILRPRLNPGGAILVVSSRLAAGDIPGRLRESENADEWLFLELPAICEAENPLGIPEGEPLWPQKFGLDELERLKRELGQAQFEAQALQRPALLAGGRLFSMSDFAMYSTLPKPQEKAFDPIFHFYNSPLNAARKSPLEDWFSVCGIDLAGCDNTSTTGSYNAIISALVSPEAMVYVTDCDLFRNVPYNALRDRIAQHLKRNHDPTSSLVVVEEASSGARLLGDTNATAPYRVMGFKPKEGKVERAQRVVGYWVEGHRVHLPNWGVGIDTLKSQLASFPAGRHDDGVDAFVYMLYAAQTIFHERERWRMADEMVRQVQGGLFIGR